MRRWAALVIVVVVVLALAGYLLWPAAPDDYVGPPSWRPMDMISILDDHTVHIGIPCATLTPFTSYRDFIGEETLIYANGLAITGSGRVEIPYNNTLIPPAEATLTFRESEHCN